MTYKQWFDSHGDKVQKIISKLEDQNGTTESIINYFDYENMKQKEPNFCPLYATGEKCHDIENLNCFFCGCPYLRFDDRNSFCSIGAKEGGRIEAEDGSFHQDCSRCLIPHQETFIKKHFHQYWFFVMKDCAL